MVQSSAVRGRVLTPGTYQKAEPKYVQDHPGLGRPVYPSELGVPVSCGGRTFGRDSGAQGSKLSLEYRHTLWALRLHRSELELLRL